ncbi:hypothetical protein HFD91_03700 [Enterobacteriaceae bacterium EKM102V]|uniref:hypothetical protein n=1 Tax=Pantoea TaxID=53335 RepID=UPI00142E74CC|nr:MULTISPECIES: hypothetical protein [Pantoea]KAF6662681.1 hypothetical protein HFD91_03700 [Enterobacteriaceae bacterium EKM102V]KAF6671147.1 hypothetical protein HFD97_03705 [Pantoea sp. EKM103V]
MNWPYILISASVISFLISIVLQIIGYVIFRRNAGKFDALVSEFRKRKLDLDISTNVSYFLSASFHPLKISYFARLYKGVKLHHKSNKMVSKESYEFIQSLPEGEIIWLVRLHSLNMIAGVMMIGGGIGFIIWRHFFN